VEQLKRHRRVHIVHWFPEGVGIACMALVFSQNSEKVFSHFPLTYFLEGDVVIAGVVLAGLASCLDAPFGPSYGHGDYKDYWELDKLYDSILKRYFPSAFSLTRTKSYVAGREDHPMD
jgi:hypothetical protein